MWLSRGFYDIHMIFQVQHWNVKRSVLNDVMFWYPVHSKTEILRHAAIHVPNSGQFSNKLPVQFPKYSFVSEWMPLKKKVEVDFYVCPGKLISCIFLALWGMKGVSPLKVKTAVYLNCLVTPVCVTTKAVCLWKSLAIQTHLFCATKNYNFYLCFFFQFCRGSVRLWWEFVVMISFQS